MKKTPSFRSLLTAATDFDLVNGTFKKIVSRFPSDVDVTRFSPAESVVALVWHSTGIIGNGGFEYLFSYDFVGDPTYSKTAEAYKLAGLDRGFEAFQQAFCFVSRRGRAARLRNADRSIQVRGRLGAS